MSIEDTVLGNNAVFVFDSGNTESDTRTASSDGGYRSKPLPTNFSEDADNIFMEIVDNPDPSQFGVLCYREGDLADSKQGLYRPSLSPSGLNHRMDKTRLQLALEELVDKGWLYPAERAGAIDLYRLSDNARENDVFMFNVNEMTKRRLYP